MPLAVVLSRGLAGLDAPLVTVEVHLAGGLPAFNNVGAEPSNTVAAPTPGRGTSLRGNTQLGTLRPSRSRLGQT